ncbi:carboxypeptidase-like regulatory domain-containing protein [Tenacibaculum sp. AHE15PA]|uniref:carboxypeptidase-like regulatory domain-containing protein n=1 Tax=unclassified Tenacibaculum TaxID=2635139 RepID=UPI001C4F005B|nr:MULTISPECIES: carboxypeptidase-like regulatory domain-containing protein [unclassified Tenacibaculum]QXP73415.1 carboxypeptidase-like regulatory domain-containing protein [Tenacibaculum sp. AHE14PA]QXP74929.1 carboxypeptidase-like regulatory domain-containing protein [Tenacibaculum sp. AHE15PA]
MKKALSVALFFLVSISFSQIKLEGVVKDSLNVSLDLANVIAINEETSVLEAYGITDEKGKYKLSLGKNGTYKIQISYIGMKTFEEVISTKEDDLNRDFILLSDNTLDEVEITYEMPVTVKGDTLIYNADSFKNGTERKLEDVLEKLPGVEINENGQIEVEGKVVNKLMVNGKDFFDGDTKLATKNIPSKAVDKIEVLRNYSEVGQLRAVSNNQNNVALNIKLKEGKENFWFGNVTVGGGSSPDKELYLVQPKLFYYNPEYSINFIGDLNNIGELALTRRDIRGFGGGFRAPSSSSGTSINLGDNSLNFLTNQANTLQVDNKLATGNFSYSPKKTLDLSGFLIYNSSRILSKETSFVQYTNPDLGIPDEETTQNGTERSNQGLLKLSASYKPNMNNQLEYDIIARVSSDTQDQRIFSSVLGNTNQLEEVTPFSINQKINYYYTLNETNIFAFEAQHLIKNEDPFYNAVLGNDPNGEDPFDTTADALGLDTSLNTYDLGQNRRIKSNQLDAKLDYFNILNTKSNLNLTLGTIISKQEFNSSIFQFLNDGSKFVPTPNFNDGKASNDITYNFSDIYLGVHYRLKAGKFTITPGFSLHAYGNENVQFGETYEDNFFRVLPDFETRIQFKKSESLTLRYEMRNQFTDVTRLAEGLVLNNYNSIQFGEPDLQNALSHNVSLFYSSFNLFNYTNVFARAAYSSNIDQVRSLTNFENVIRTSTFFNSNFADENVNVFGRVQRTFGKIRASLNASFNYSKINQLIQGTQSLNKGYTQSYTPGVRTNYREAPNVSLRYRYSITNNDQGSRSTTFTTNAPSIEFDAYIKKRITFKTNYTYTNQDLGNGNSQSFQNWDATLSYRKDRDAKWEYEIKATNLLNIDSQVRNSANNLSVFSSETFIQPRFVTFRFVYTL